MALGANVVLKAVFVAALLLTHLAIPPKLLKSFGLNVTQSPLLTTFIHFATPFGVEKSGIVKETMTLPQTHKEY